MTDWTIWHFAGAALCFLMLSLHGEKGVPIFWAVVAANIFLKAVF